MRYLRYALLGLAALGALLAGPAPVAQAATFTVTKIADTNDGTCDGDCSLREAIEAANALAGADTITVPAGTYTLSIAGTSEDANATGDLDITDDLTINGAGATTTIIDGGAADRVFHIPGSGTTVEMSGLAIQNGGAVFFGGGILNFNSTLTLTSSTVRDNTATHAAGIFGTNGSTLTLNSSTVSGNTTSVNGSGGGMWVGGHHYTEQCHCQRQHGSRGRRHP